MTKIRNYCVFTIKGLNQEHFFNKLSKDYFIYEINRIERNKTSFKVSFKDAKKVKKIILSNHFEILSEEKKGLIYSIFSLRKSYGYVFGITVCLIAFFCQLPFVWRVEVNGLESEIQNEVEVFLSQKVSHLKSEIDCKEIEKDLQDEFKDLSFVSVSIVGQTIVVNAKTREEQVEKDGNFLPIKAECDGIITKLQLIQGTLVVEVGDVIKEGETIVEPYIIDSNGEKKSVEAKIVYSFETWISGSENHYQNEYVFQRTGNFYIEENLTLFGLEIYSHGKENSYQNFEVEESQKYFSKNNILPFIYVKKTYFETEQVLIFSNYIDVREEIIEKAKQKALQKMQDCDIIKEEKCVEKQNGDVEFVTYYLIIEREIAIK